MRHSRAVLTTCVVGAAILAATVLAVGGGDGSSGAAAEPAVAAGWAPTAGERQAAIRRVYQAYAERSAAAEGRPVEVAIDDFRTVDAGDFDEVAFFPDLATLTSDWELATVIDIRVELGEPGREIRFRPEWRLVEDPPPEALLGRPAREMFEGRTFGERKRVERLTSYRVEVSYDGLARTYRAAAMWLHEADGTLAFEIADNVMPEVGLAVDDGRGPGSLLADRFVAEPRLAQTEVAGQCTPERTVRRFGQPGFVADAMSPPRSDRRPAFVGVYACSCAADCAARCEATTEATYDGCRAVPTKREDGRRQRALAVTYSVDDSTPPGLRATCSAHLNCELLDCPNGVCGHLMVRVEPTAGGLRLDTAGGTGGGDGFGRIYRCGECSPF